MKETTNVPESGFVIENIALLVSNFKRELKVTFDPALVEVKLHVNVEVGVNENTVQVLETVQYTQEVESVPEVHMELTMIGVFQKVGDVALDLDTFGRINGAAIIYPYIREHVTNIAAKAGIGLVILPPFNFTANSDKNPKKEK